MKLFRYSLIAIASFMTLWIIASLFDLDEVTRPGASGDLTSWNIIPIVLDKAEAKEIAITATEECTTECASEIAPVQYEFIECPEVDLSRELQQKIYKFAYANGISPFLVFAIAERESNYQSDLIGDNGEAVGMMQVQIRFFGNIMDELGIQEYTAAEPYNNACLAIKVLRIYFEKGEDDYWCLMAYNGGESYANKHRDNPSEYAREVLERADELEKAQLSNRLN